MNFGKIYDFFYEKRKALALILLAAIVIFAFWLRYRLLGVKDFWIDEYFTEDGAFYTFGEMWKKGHTRTTLLFSVIMKYYAALLCHFNPKTYLTPFELRLPNVIFGTLLVVQVYFLVRKISDIFTGLLASTICAFIPYLVYYSRDGRYYPLMLVCVAICFWAAFSILSTSFDDKKQLKYHLVYMLGGFCGMFAHYGFWIYFALSNSILCLILCYRFFFEPSNDTFLKKAGKASLQVLTMAIPAFAVPLIVYKRNGSGISTVLSNNIGSNIHMLQSLSFDSINYFCRDFYSDFRIFALYSILIIAFISLLLLAFHKQRKVVLYLAAIRFLTFILLRLTPRSIIQEPLRTRYLMYILLIDIIIFSLFTGELLEYIYKAFSKLSKTLSTALYVLLALALLFTVSYYSSKKVFTSDLKIYKSFTTPSKTASKIKEFFKDGDIVMTDNMDVFYAFPYYSKIDKQLENVRCLFLGWLKRPSIKNSAILLLTDNPVNILPNLKYLGTHAGVHYSRYTIPADLYADDIALIVSKIVNTTSRHVIPTMDRWSKIKSNALQYIKSPHEEKNLILNPNFDKGFDYWRVTKNGDAKIDLISTNGQNIVRFTGKGDWSTLSQTIDVAAGITNKFIIDIKCDNRPQDMDIVLSYHDITNAIHYIDFPKSRTTNIWTKTIKLLSFDTPGKIPVRIQYRNKLDEGIAYIGQIKAVELRDKNANIAETQEEESDPNQVIKNSDFKSYYAYWEGALNHFVITESDDGNIISFTPLSEKKTWFKLKQFFTANKGDVYELSYDERRPQEYSPQSKAFLVFSYVDDKGTDSGEKYFQLDAKKPDWQHKTHKINITDTQKACFRLQFTGHPLCEVKNIKLVKSEEE